MSDDRPHRAEVQRVRVTGPRSGRPRPTTVAAEIDRQSEMGEIYMRSLVRAQLRAALRTVALLLLTVGSLPIVFRIWPAVRRWELLGIPLSWLVLGGLVYPLLVLLGWGYLRRAERNERDFHDLVGPR